MADWWFAEANLRPVDTGLPMVVLVSERGNVRHDAQVRVCSVHGSMLFRQGSMASLAVRPHPHVLAGRLLPGDLDAVSRWITLNEAVILGYWDGLISTHQMLQRLRRL